MYVCMHTNQIHPGRKNSYLERHFFYHTYSEREKKEAHSFLLWLKTNISEGQELIVTVYCLIVWVLLLLWWFSCECEKCCDPLNGLSITSTDLSVQGTPNLGLWAQFLCPLLGPSASQVSPLAVVLPEREEWDHHVSLPLKWACTHLLGLFPGQAVSCIRSRLATAVELRRKHTKLKELVKTSWSLWQKTSFCEMEDSSPASLSSKILCSSSSSRSCFHTWMKTSIHTSLECEFWLSCESVAPMSKCHVLPTLGKSQQRFSKYSHCLCFSIKSSNFPLVGIWKVVHLTKVSSCPAGSDPRLSINQSQVLELRELINTTFPSPGGSDDNEEGMAQADHKPQ